MKFIWSESHTSLAWPSPTLGTYYGWRYELEWNAFVEFMGVFIFAQMVKTSRIAALEESE
jgi:hypothetical protein